MLLLLFACQTKEATFTGWETTTISLSQADYHFIGENNGDYAGYSVSHAGDVDGDSHSDFLISADHNHQWGFATGKVYLFLGGKLPKPGEYSLGTADYIFTAESDEDLLGHGLAPAGDLDGDGLGEFLVSAYVDSNEHLENGSVYLIHGNELQNQQNITMNQIETKIIGDATLDRLGHDIASGDLNGDGVNDIMTGAYGHDQDRGRTYIFLSSIQQGFQRTASQADIIIEGETRGDKSGYSLAFVGDVNSDGYPEVHISSKERSQSRHHAGKTYLLSGANLLQQGNIQEISDSEHQFHGLSSFELCCNPSYLGDLDGDGANDLLFGSQFNMDADDWIGSSYIILASSLGESGTFDLTDADYIFAEENTGDMLGNGLSDLGDIDKDGLPDILLGAFLNTPTTSSDGGGTSYLFYGHQFSSLPQDLAVSQAAHQFESSIDREGSGRGLTNVGDVNADSLNDILIGAPMEPNERENSTGGAYLFLTPGSK
jgi:hypothetical protein